MKSKMNNWKSLTIQVGYALSIQLFYDDIEEILISDYEMAVGIGNYFKCDTKKILDASFKNNYKITLDMIKNITSKEEKTKK